MTLELHQKVAAVVELVKDTYLVRSLQCILTTY
jgi:hypothetical protein